MFDGLPARARILVAQPLPGIGDMIWHLPHLRALRDAAPAGATLHVWTKRRSAADQLLAGQGIAEDVQWLGRDPSAPTRGLTDGALDLARRLRSHRYDMAIVLHHGSTLASLLAAAGIPRRHGYGVGLQRFFLRPPFLTREQAASHPHAQATAWLAAAQIAIADPEPSLIVTPAARAEARAALGFGDAPFVAFGIGSSEPEKQWGAERFAALADRLAEAGHGPVVPVGGPAECDLAAGIVSHATTARVVPAIGLPLGQAAATLAAATVLIGNDTGMLNLAAAVGTRAIGLFGATPPLEHARRIEAVRPLGTGGMDAISVDAVLDAVAHPSVMVGEGRPPTPPLPAQ